MSIIIHIYYTGIKGNALKFAKEMVSSGTVSKIRQAEGNLAYDYFVSMDNEETVLLVDRWTDQEAIDRHHASSMMDTILNLREKYDLSMRVERYVSDEAGIPETDQKFIRE